MKFLFLCMLFSFAATAFCQKGIRGKIVSDKDEAVPQANVFISNTSIGTYTNATGEFTLNNVPEGAITIVVSHVAYEVETVPVLADAHSKYYIVRLQPKSNELSAVLIGKYDKRGWKKWGDTFTEAFLGTAAYAKNCVIQNKDAVYFIYNSKTKQLRAYASENLLIENRALGYQLTVTLADFMYDLSDKVVDYQVFTLFKELEGTADEELQWRKNRADVYSLSLMHFMRALHARNFRNEGFQVRWIEVKPNKEKQRVQALYKESFSRVKDSSGNEESNDVAVAKLVEKSFAKDSLLYYTKVLEEKDRTENLHLELLQFKDIARPADDNTVLLNFDGYIQVTYTKAKEPAEYTAYKNKLYGNADLPDANSLRSYPSTEFRLLNGMPVAIDERGYCNNSNLYIAGFWGWWEKLATKLPYEYEP